MTVPKDTLEFIQRWKRKGQRYSLDCLEHYFDRFFTAFVLYNFFYETIGSKLQPNWKKDQEKASKVAKRFLGAGRIFADPVIRQNGDKIRSLIEAETFYIRDKTWDAHRIKMLTPTDPEQWVNGLLEIIYGIRCNMFHGQKEFDESQKAILDPCIAVIERLNELFIEKLHV